MFKKVIDLIKSLFHKRNLFIIVALAVSIVLLLDDIFKGQFDTHKLLYLIYIGTLINCLRLITELYTRVDILEKRKDFMAEYWLKNIYNVFLHEIDNLDKDLELGRIDETEYIEIMRHEIKQLRVNTEGDLIKNNKPLQLLLKDHE